MNELTQRLMTAIAELPPGWRFFVAKSDCGNNWTIGLDVVCNGELQQVEESFHINELMQEWDPFEALAQRLGRHKEYLARRLAATKDHFMSREETNDAT